MALTKAGSNSIDLSSDNSSLDIPKGTTAEAPGVATATDGSVRFDTDEGKMQVYTTADGWVNLKSNIPPPPFALEYLSVAGGGGGGDAYYGGGGGAGGYLTSSPNAVSININNSIAITVGKAGNAGTSGNGGNGGNTSIISPDISVTSIGGGGGAGGGVSGAAGSGGSGGGGDSWQGDAPGSGTPGQGFDGAAYNASSGAYYGGGGGGGASQAGRSKNNSNLLACKGGDGLTWIDSITYAGGGAGARNANGPCFTPQGGAGGGGNGAPGAYNCSSTAAQAGTDGLGGGGGAGSWSSGQVGARGGSGVLILKYPNAFTVSMASPSNITMTQLQPMGNDKLTKFTCTSATSNASATITFA